MNKLYFGDNLNILRDNIKDETVDLIYLDPPFNSKRDYNLLIVAERRSTHQPRVKRSGTLGKITINFFKP